MSSRWSDPLRLGNHAAAAAALVDELAGSIGRARRSFLEDALLRLVDRAPAGTLGPAFAARLASSVTSAIDAALVDELRARVGRVAAPALGQVLVPLTGALPGSPAFVWRFALVEESAGGAIAMAPATRAAVARGVRAGLAALPYPVPLVADGQALAIVEGPAAGEAVEIDGPSLGAGAALLAWSIATAVALPSTIAVTGDVADDGRVLPVAGVAAKVAACLRERWQVERVLVPSPNLGELPGELRARAVGVTDVEELVALALPSPVGAKRPRRRASPFDLASAVRRIDDEYRTAARRPDGWERALRRIDALLAALPPPPALVGERVLMQARGAACNIHLARSADARRPLARALRLADRHPGEIDPGAIVQALIHAAVAQHDAYDLDGAIATATRALPLAEGQRGELAAKVRGTLGQSLVAAGRCDDGCAELERALAWFERHKPDEAARNLSYLAWAAWRSGGSDDRARARRHLADGMRRCRRDTPLADRPLQRAFLALTEARCDLDDGDAKHAAATVEEALALEPPPWPRLGLLRVLADARARTRGDVAAALTQLDACSSDGSPLVRWHAALGHAAALAGRLEHDETPSPDELRRIVNAIPREARRWFARERAALTRLLRRASPTATELAAALRALCRREPR